MSANPDADSHPRTDHVFGGYNLLIKSLHEVDDRGLALSLAAFAEDALGDLLKAFMLPIVASSRLIEGFHAPIGTFSARIKAAYSLGLLTTEQFNDLERLRKLRNVFAHTWRPITIKDPAVAGLISAMTYSRISNNFPETLSEKLRSSMGCVLVEIRATTDQIRTRGTGVKLTGNHLIPGFAGTEHSQLGHARDELEDIIQKIDSSEGEKKNFFLWLLSGFARRLDVLAKPKTAGQMQELSDLQEVIRIACLRHSGSAQRLTSP